jgi:molecular chaperone HscC
LQTIAGTATFPEGMALTIAGIDLGTTNSLIALLEGATPVLVPNKLGKVLTPSAVSVAEDGTILVGEAAKDRLLTHPDASIASFKRLMGTSQAIRLGKLSFRPEELSSLVLRALKADAEEKLGQPLTEAVISVPAYFNDMQRKATIDAGRLAGLTVERLVNEPTAAALAYGFGEAAEGKYLVFDLGGGTFDVSILDKYQGIMEIHATTGDTRLGGDDFTRALEDMILRAAKMERDKLDAVGKARLVRAGEAAKHKLTSATEADFALTLGAGDVSGILTRADFEAEAAPLLRRLRAPTERALRDARLEPSAFDAIVLVGGATRMPMVRQMVARLFGKLPLININPDTTIGLGAAIQAGLHKRSAALADTVMTDVCPYTLGVAALVGDGTPAQARVVVPIIERNAVVPISRSNPFTTVQAGQKILAIEVYQGENMRPEDNIHLGTIEAPIPAGKAGEESVTVQFTYDINGALQVEVTVDSTQKKLARIFRNAMGLDEAELAKRFAALAELKLHPREQLQNKTLLARAARLYAEALGADRDTIRQLLLTFESGIGDQQVRDLDAIRAEFGRELDRFERSPFSS